MPARRRYPDGKWLKYYGATETRSFFPIVCVGCGAKTDKPRQDGWEFRRCRILRSPFAARSRFERRCATCAAASAEVKGA